MMTTVQIIDVAKIPICPACLYDFHEEYSQNGCETNAMTRPQTGNFSAIASCPPIVKIGMATCAIELKVLSSLIYKLTFRLFKAKIMFVA